MKDDKCLEKVLFFSVQNPFALSNGAQKRFYELVKYFSSKGVPVDLVVLDGYDSCDNSAGDNALPNTSVISFEHKRPLRYIINVILSKLKLAKIKSADFSSALLADRFRSLDLDGYSHFILSYVQWAGVADVIPDDVQKILLVEDLMAKNMQDRHGAAVDYEACLSWEIEQTCRFDKVIFISEQEKEIFEKKGRKSNLYLPYFVENCYKESSERSSDIIYVASGNPFNVKGADWFFRNVVPMLESDTSITVIGSICKELGDVADRFENVNLRGYVEDVAEEYNKHKIAVCPMFGGTGLKVKVVEALSYGLPVVSTSDGITGMPSLDGIVTADTPEAFAEALRTVLHDGKKLDIMSESAQRNFLDHFDLKSAYKTLDSFFGE